MEDNGENEEKKPIKKRKYKKRKKRKVSTVKRKPYPKKTIHKVGAKPKTKELLDKHNYHLQIDKTPPVYQQEKYLRVYQGYDLLENLQIVRDYIETEHQICHKTLNTLLYVMPKNYFQRGEINEVIKFYPYIPVIRLVEQGLAKVAFKKKEPADNPELRRRIVVKSIYTLTAKGRNVVKEFYDCLSGVKPLQEKVFRKLYPGEDGYKAQHLLNIKSDLIKKFNLLPPNENRLNTK